ncbi:MAG: sugar phosphate isomerase/epimerase family protein, partial [Eubacteriales bacterium]|nr:sugar phosphate isomerase/epimerase family protein [Eubacteriales bacterium]
KPEDDLGQYFPEEGEARLLEMMRPGFRIGARFLILHLGAYPPGERRLAVLGRIREIVRRTIPALAEHAAVLCLENNTSLYTPNAVGCSVFEWDVLFDGLDSPHVAMCLDTGHAHVNGCLPEITRVMKNRIRYIHLHDNDGVRDSHRAPGMGSIDWAAWYPMLAALPREPWVMFEYPRADGYAKAIADIRLAENGAGRAQ